MATSTLKRWGRQAWRAPAVHFAILGALFFLGSSRLAERQAADRPRLVVPASRVAKAERAFATEVGRPPTAPEKTALVERLIDEEVLFQHALALGMHHAEIPQRRLAKIAAFVEPAENEAPEAELAQRAVEIGLHEGDYVTRRVLIDAAERLIRAAARVREPDDETLKQVLERHGEHFRGAGRIRITHLLLSAARRSHPTDDAGALLVRLHREQVSPEDAVALADSGRVPPHLPLLTERALDRRFGPGFTAGLSQLPEGVWSGPVASRHGAHLVFVHERHEGRVPELAEAHDKVLALWRETASERWLTERLRQLRDGYEVVVESEVAS